MEICPFNEAQLYFLEKHGMSIETLHCDQNRVCEWISYLHSGIALAGIGILWYVMVVESGHLTFKRRIENCVFYFILVAGAATMAYMGSKLHGTRKYNHDQISCEATKYVGNSIVIYLIGSAWYEIAIKPPHMTLPQRIMTSIFYFSMCIPLVITVIAVSTRGFEAYL